MAKKYANLEALEYYHSKVKTVIKNYVDSLDLQDGITPNIQIGEVETLQPGSEVVVTITGTPEEPILNIGIPRGEDGDMTNSEIENIDAVVRNIEQNQENIDSKLKELSDMDKGINQRLDSLESKVDTSLDNGSVKIDTSGVVIKNNASIVVKGDGNNNAIVLDENGGTFNNVITEKITFAYHQVDKTSVDSDDEVTGFFFVGGAS